MFPTFFGSDTAIDSKAFRIPSAPGLIPIGKQDRMQESLDDHGIGSKLSIDREHYEE
jgi:hypothetical protein